MDYFIVETDYDPTGNSPWDLLWYEGDVHALDCLGGSLALATIWKSPPITRISRKRTPNVFVFANGSNFAVDGTTKNLLEPLVGIEVEFLPLKVGGAKSLFLIHSLWPVDFDDRAEFDRQGSIGNITTVRKYSFTFDLTAFNGPRHIFRLRQARRSPARDAGFTWPALIVSEKIRDACQSKEVTGVVLKKVHSA